MQSATARESRLKELKTIGHYILWNIIDANTFFDLIISKVKGCVGPL